jgi:hypothetical protein
MKKVEQVLEDGSIVLDYDQPLSVKEIGSLFYDLFGNNSYGTGHQHILYGKIGALVANITYLGHPWPLFKKRIQLKDYYPEVFIKNEEEGLDTLFIGVYHYKTTYLFAVFDPSLYIGRKSHNSSAHIQTFDLQYALKAGTYSKTDSNGHFIRVMDANSFVNFIKERATSPIKTYDYGEVFSFVRSYLDGFFTSLPKGTWNGIKCFKKMISSSYANARQGAWEGWYFEFLFKNYLASNPTNEVAYYGDKKKSGIDFDLIFPKKEWTFGDLKSDKADDDILGNKFQSFDIVLEQNNGIVYYIVLQYESELDKKHGYKTTLFWNQYRDKERQYKTMEEIKTGYGIRMKYSVKPKEIKVLSINKTAYEILKQDPFHQGKNSDGKCREDKLRVNKDMVEALCVYSQTL